MANILCTNTVTTQFKRIIEFSKEEDIQLDFNLTKMSL